MTERSDEKNDKLVLLLEAPWEGKREWATASSAIRDCVRFDSPISRSSDTFLGTFAVQAYKGAAGGPCLNHQTEYRSWFSF